MKASRLEAAIFDFDGVIVNSEPLHCAAFQRILEPLGIAFTWDDYIEFYLGFDDRDAIRQAFRQSGKRVKDAELPALIDAKARAFEALAEERGAEPYPGVVELIRALDREVPVALCSGALRRDAEPILRKLGLRDCFKVMVTADEVAVSKPDPSSYRLAVKRLAEVAGRVIDARHSVAIEDTPAGIEAAAGAGLKVLAVANSYKADKLSGATRVVDSLAGVTPEDLARLVAG
ncbi:MAG TPA: HAD family phosphatase [Kiritimatiellia bacterium]|nr:HAD family phosphatase [Kiritimatiellia bacterium]